MRLYDDSMSWEQKGTVEDEVSLGQRRLWTY